MTVGMLIESIAGKAACLHGKTHADASTFRNYEGRFGVVDKNGKKVEANNEDNVFLQKKQKKSGFDKPGTAADYFGAALLEKGFEELGTEEMYCGMYGEVMPVRIFLGCIYYQRLRHMVNDKMQARST